jgi:hypothetical protein
LVGWLVEAKFGYWPDVSGIQNYVIMGDYHEVLKFVSRIAYHHQQQQQQQ